MSTSLTDTTETRYIQGPSARFAYRRIGTSGGVPLVLLHRFRATIDEWDPQFVDYLAAAHDVIIFDNVGTGYTSGQPRDSMQGFAEGAIEFIDALGLATVDLLGWSLGGYIALEVTRVRPELVRKLVVAAAGPGGQVPGMPAPNEDVLRVASKPEPEGEDLLFLFYPDTERARAAGREHLANISRRLAAGGPAVSPEATMGQLAAIGAFTSTPFEQVQARLQTLNQPVLIANGAHDIMIPAIASYQAVQHLDDATLVLYSDAGHAFLFQHAEAFVAQVTTFLTTSAAGR
jgi:pimeloyl-ACP methyl ester carboxylesterase